MNLKDYNDRAKSKLLKALLTFSEDNVYFLSAKSREYRLKGKKISPFVYAHSALKIREIADEMGIKNVDKFISTPPTEPPPPSAQEQLQQVQAQAMMTQAQATQLEAEVKAKELEIKAAKLELERVEIEHDMAVKREELKLKGIELGFEMNSDKNIRA